MSDPLPTPSESPSRPNEPPPASPAAVWRILDANANRLLEGLRTWEDYARFVMQSAAIAEQTKRLRQECGHVVAQLPPACRLGSRNSAGDVGTAIQGPREQDRADTLAVAAAALSRCQEALRCLEEYSKVVLPPLAPSFESLRYQVYDLQAAAADPVQRRQRLAQSRLCLLATCQQIHEHLLPQLKQFAQIGPLVIQLRDKQSSAKQQLETARACIHAFQGLPLLLIINDRPDLAVLSQADGVHVGDEDLPPRDARKIVGPARLLGISTHHQRQLEEAIGQGADYVGFGPIAPTPTKSFDQYVGVAAAGEANRRATVPLFAIGGIGLQEAAKLAQVGVGHAAVSSAVWNAESPVQMAEAIARALGSGDHRATTPVETISS